MNIRYTYNGEYAERQFLYGTTDFGAKYNFIELNSECVILHLPQKVDMVARKDAIKSKCSTVYGLNSDGNQKKAIT